MESLGIGGRHTRAEDADQVIIKWCRLSWTTRENRFKNSALVESVYILTLYGMSRCFKSNLVHPIEDTILLNNLDLKPRVNIG